MVAAPFVLASAPESHERDAQSPHGPTKPHGDLDIRGRRARGHRSCATLRSRIRPARLGTRGRIDHARYARTVLPPLPTSSGAARRFLRDRLNDWGYPLAVAEVPCLLVSELVTNAIVHTGTWVGLELRLVGRRLRSAVSDESSRLPVPRPCGAGDDTGRGLHLVEKLAQEWSVETTDGGKAVW